MAVVGNATILNNTSASMAGSMLTTFMMVIVLIIHGMEKGLRGPDVFFARIGDCNSHFLSIAFDCPWSGQDHAHIAYLDIDPAFSAAQKFIVACDAMCLP